MALDGEILVRVGDEVRASTVVARADLPGPIQSMNVAAALGIPRDSVPGAVRVEAGDEVVAGEVLARSSTLFGLIRHAVIAPFDGVVESISGVSGQLVMRAAPSPLELLAYLDGRITAVLGRAGVQVEAEVSMVQGIFGMGRETSGEVAMLVSDPATPLTAELLETRHKGMVVVGGGRVTGEALAAARALGVAAVVAGSASGGDLVRLAGREINPAATGDEDLGFTLVLTEGFGALPMSARAFELLLALRGSRVSASGATQVRAGVVRPEIVGPPLDVGDGMEIGPGAIIGRGTPVRVVRGEAFGRQATVVSVPERPMAIGSGSSALVYEVRFPDGQVAMVPRANVEP